jgi:hypothetical protein
MEARGQLHFAAAVHLGKIVAISIGKKVRWDPESVWTL